MYSGSNFIDRIQYDQFQITLLNKQAHCGSLIEITGVNVKLNTLSVLV